MPESSRTQRPVERTDGRAGPRVVFFRHSPVPRDSRAKKLALTLARAGYDVVIVSAEGPDASLGESRLGPVRIVHLPVAPDHVKANNDRLIRNRKRRYPVLAPASVQGRGTQVKGRQVRASQAARQAAAIRQRKASAGSASQQARVMVRWALKRAQSELFRRELQIVPRRNKLQARIDAAVGRGWKRYDAKRVNLELGASARRDLPEILDLAAALRPVLLQLRPDVLHAHHPFVLGVADEVQIVIKRFLAILEPAMILGLAVMVGGIVFSILLGVMGMSELVG